MAEAREVKLKGLLEVYEEPDSHAGLYNYAKALEDVEAGLLAGFFYKHFCLASNVIGSESKGEIAAVQSPYSMVCTHIYRQVQCVVRSSSSFVCMNVGSLGQYERACFGTGRTATQPARKSRTCPCDQALSAGCLVQAVLEQSSIQL